MGGLGSRSTVAMRKRVPGYEIPLKGLLAPRLGLFVRNVISSGLTRRSGSGMVALINVVELQWRTGRKISNIPKVERWLTQPVALPPFSLEVVPARA